MVPLYENKVHSGVILSIFAYIFWVVHAALIVPVIPTVGILWSITFAFAFSAIFTLLFTIMNRIPIYKVEQPRVVLVQTVIGALLLTTYILCAYYASLYTVGVFTIGSYLFLVIYQRAEPRLSNALRFTVYVSIVIGYFHFLIHEDYTFMLGALAGFICSFILGATRSVRHKGKLNKYSFVLSFLQPAFSALVAFILAWFYGGAINISPNEWLLLVSSGFFLFLTHHYFHFSYRFAQGLVIGAMSWVGFAVAAFIQICLWNQYLSLTQYIGTILVVVASFALMKNYAFSEQ